ncbi:MAG: histidine kinase [Cyclobacteriaceae bacterium]
MRHVKKYSVRVLIGALIHLFFEITHSETIQQALDYQMLKVTSLFYMVIVVLLLWEVLDFSFDFFDRRDYDYSSSRQLAKIVAILTMVTFPLVCLATLVHDVVLMPMLDCRPEELDLYKGAAQGQILAWLVISARLLRTNSEHVQRIERDKAIIQKDLLVSQYENLKSQVNPHFLFNSFSVLQSLIETDPEKAGQFLAKLSKLYRYILENEHESMVSLEKELAILDDYSFLLRMRHHESVQIKVDIKEELLTAFVPSMSLQMLIENAVKHNKFSSREPLEIKIYSDNNYLVVSNKVSRKGESVSSTKIGLENIKSRYEFQTSEPLVVEETEGRFVVKMPILSTIRLA